MVVLFRYVCVCARACVLCGNTDLSQYFSIACAGGTDTVEQTFQGTLMNARRKEKSYVMLEVMLIVTITV